MMQAIEFYSLLSINMIPKGMFAFVCISMCVGSLFLMLAYGKERGGRYSLALFLVEYVFLIYGSTVFFRPTFNSPQYNFVPFWSYVADNRKEELVSENFLNIIFFIPIGLLIGILVRRKNRILFHGFVLNSSYSCFFALFIGITLSIGIETLQFLLKRGFSELDDVIHNTLGFMIGYGATVLYKR